MLTFCLLFTLVLETELLMDYYLVPGAAWSLIKKGETVQIIGKAKNNTWFRCMALRESKVELDKTPFSFMIKSMINKPSRKASRSKELSGITPEMIEEEYAQRDLDEAFNNNDTTFIEVLLLVLYIELTTALQRVLLSLHTLLMLKSHLEHAIQRPRPICHITMRFSLCISA